MAVFSGKCLCGQVQVSVRGEPLRVGICHCTDCRQESGSAFTFYAIWPVHQFERVGETSEFQGRHFCARCGSRLFSVDDREAELKLGVLSEAPTPSRAELRALDPAPRAVAAADRRSRTVRGEPRVNPGAP
jgi:hypothetical protein